MIKNSIMKTKLLVVMDGSHARFFDFVGDGRKEIRQIKSLDISLVPAHLHDHGKPGRVFESATIAKHAYESTDWGEKQKEKFLDTVLGEIDTFLKTHTVRVIIYLMAPSHILGLLRKKRNLWEKGVEIIEVAKDLTNSRKEHIEKILHKFLEI